MVLGTTNEAGAEKEPQSSAPAFDLTIMKVKIMSIETVELLNAHQVAKILNVSTRTLWRLKSAGKLPEPVRIGGSVRWHPQDIHELITRKLPR